MITYLDLNVTRALELISICLDVMTVVHQINNIR